MLSRRSWVFWSALVAPCSRLHAEVRRGPLRISFLGFHRSFMCLSFRAAQRSRERPPRASVADAAPASRSPLGHCFRRHTPPRPTPARPQRGLPQGLGHASRVGGLEARDSGHDQRPSSPQLRTYRTGRAMRCRGLCHRPRKRRPAGNRSPPGPDAAQASLTACDRSLPRPRARPPRAPGPRGASPAQLAALTPGRSSLTSGRSSRVERLVDREGDAGSTPVARSFEKRYDELCQILGPRASLSRSAEF